MPETAPLETAEVARDERSALAYRISGTTTPGECTLILLPAAPGSDERLLQFIRDSGWQGKVITLQPPRAIYCGEQLQGFTWYHALEPHTIEPTSFMDSLWQLERFVLDLLEDDADAELMLIGEGEGASLILAALPYLHDRIAGAIMIGGQRPTFIH